jgi:hypothetical protein
MTRVREERIWHIGLRPSRQLRRFGWIYKRAETLQIGFVQQYKHKKFVSRHHIFKLCQSYVVWKLSHVDVLLIPRKLAQSKIDWTEATNLPSGHLGLR